mgnify:CR=1 FL=1
MKPQSQAQHVLDALAGSRTPGPETAKWGGSRGGTFTFQSLLGQPEVPRWHFSLAGRAAKGSARCAVSAGDGRHGGTLGRRRHH